MDIFVVGLASVPFFNDMMKGFQYVRSIKKPKTDADDIHMTYHTVPKIEEFVEPEEGEPKAPLNLDYAGKNILILNFCARDMS